MSTADQRPNLSPWALLWALVLVAVLGAGAIALERPTGQATGRVLALPAEAPLEGAKVTFSGPVTRSLLTRPDGTYQFSNLPVGKYYVSARARAYDPQWHQGEVEIKEGHVAAGIDFKLSRTVPSLEVANTQRVFTPQEPHRLYLRGTQVREFEVTLYQLNLEAALALADGLEGLRRADTAALEARGVIKRLKAFRQPVNPEKVGDDDWFYQPVQLEGLPVGPYLAAFRADPERQSGDLKAPERISRSYWFTVSKLALVAKRGDHQLLAYAVDLETRKPVSGADVRVVGSVPLGPTGPDGLLRWDRPLPDGTVTLLARHQGSVALCRSYHYREERAYRIYAYTDRPVYRPGQKVFFKGTVRRDQEARYRPAPGATVRMVLKDATGNELLDSRYALDAESAFNGELTLPEEAALGEYNAELTIDGGSYQALSFKVADYRKPEFKVEINPSKPRYAFGDTADIHLLANYYFGAPVPGAKVLVTVYSAPLYWDRDPEADFFGGFVSEPGLEPYWGYGDVVHQTDGQTDAEGRFKLSVPLPRPEAAPDDWIGDRVYTVSVEGMDASQRPVKATQSFRVTQGDIRLSVDTDQSVYAPKQGIDVVVEAKDYDGKPVAARATVTVTRLEYEEKKTEDGDEYTETKPVKVHTGTLETDRTGRGRLTVPGVPEGSYVIQAAATDAAGHPVIAQTWTWVAGDASTAGTYRYEALQVVMDKKVYRPGMTARALVVAPVPDLAVLVTVEGTRLHSQKVVRLKGTSAVVELPVTEAHAPNAFVVATAVNGKELMTTERSLNVLPEEKFLKVTLTADKSRYEPGETATYTVETRDWKGKPVSAEVTLGVVDQAVYAIEPEHTPDIRGFFHGPRWNSVSTSHSFPEDYSGGLDKMAPDPRVRARLEDTAAWYPKLKTGADGRVSVSFQLPDNLTTWVATARAATADTRVGAAGLDVVATKDLLVRLETPRFVVQGDRVVISAIAHNYTDTAQDVELSLAVTGLELADAAPRTVALAPGDARRVAWEATVKDLGTATAKVVARGRTDGDALLLPVPALPFGLEQVSAFAGAATPEAPGTVSTVVPPQANPGTVALSLSLHTSPVPAILGAVDYLHRFEYGCVEQTMSRFLPDVAISRRLAALGVPTGDRFSDHETRVRDGLRRLVSFQHGDGGWGWWSHDESAIETTSYVLYGLAEARRGGATVSDDVVRRGLDHLKRKLPQIGKDLYTRHAVRRDAGADARAFALFALAHWGTAPKPELDRLWADRQTLSTYGLAQFTLALAQSGDFRRFEALDALLGRVEETETQASWPSGAREYAWQDNTTETTAYALRALLAVSPEEARVAKAVRWLESKNVRGYWDSTKDTGAAAIALADYLRSPQGAPSTGYTARVLVNDQEVAVYTPDPAHPYAPPAEIRLPMEQLRAGANAVRVELTGAGHLDFTGALRYFDQPSAIAAESAHGLTVKRDYFRLPADVYAKAKGQGTFADFYNEELVKALPRLGDRVEAGERVLVRVTLTNEKALRYMVLEDPLPAGCEILEDQPDNWNYWWDHQEYRDEKAAFFFRQLPAGTRTLYYVMRPTTQGRYRVLPPLVWAMYTPEVRAHGADQALTITE